MDNALIKLNETLERINQNLILLKNAIASGVGVYTPKDALFSVTHDHLGEPLSVVLEQNENKRLAVMVHQDPSDGLDVRITNEPLNVEVSQDPLKTYNVRLHDLEEAGKLDVAVCNCVQVDTNS
jgi:hypothetical protein